VQAREDFRKFLDVTHKQARVCIMHDSDADGVTAGVVLQRALERLGYTSVARLAPDRERNAWTPGKKFCDFRRAAKQKTLATKQH